MTLGYNRESAQRIVMLLNQKEQLDWYLNRGTRANCQPITRASEQYPLILRKRLGLDSPGCLWVKGDISLLSTPTVALVGSRQLRNENREFARQVGRQAALQGVTLVSGNARGADREAQDSCLACGGKVICVLADRLDEKNHDPRILYLAEDGYDLDFSAQRALSRNRIIHSLGRITLVAQSNMEKGGTWDGTCKNLQNRWSPVFCFADGSSAVDALVMLGAQTIALSALADFPALQMNRTNLFDQ